MGLAVRLKLHELQVLAQKIFRLGEVDVAEEQVAAGQDDAALLDFRQGQLIAGPVGIRAFVTDAPTIGNGCLPAITQGLMSLSQVKPGLALPFQGKIRLQQALQNGNRLDKIVAL